MVTRKDLVIAVLSTFCLVSTLFMIVPTRSQTTHPYDPWIDTDDDGDIDLYDAVELLTMYGSKGTPINKTELLLELQARVDELNTTVALLQEQIDQTSFRVYAGIEYLITGIHGEVTIAFPQDMFTNASKMSLAATAVFVYCSIGYVQGHPARVVDPVLSVSNVTLTIQFLGIDLNWRDADIGEEVEVAYTVVET